MISLKQSSDPYEIELLEGVSVTVKPLRRSGVLMARAVASERLRSIRQQFDDLREAGLATDHLPDFDRPGVEDAVWEDMVVKEIACGHIVGWGGVFGPDDEPAEVTREAVLAFVDIQIVGERFYAKYLVHQAMLDSAKNASGPSLNGSSVPAAAGATAQPAGTADSRAPTAGPDSTGSAAPTSSTAGEAPRN